jgi:hypothetical protein
MMELGDHMMWARLAVVAMLLVGSQGIAQQDGPLKMGQHGSDTFVGLISDSACGPRHKLKDKSAEECTRTCVRNGAQYALVAGSKVYLLQGDTNDLAYLAGQKAKITGSLSADTITVSSVAPTQ